MENLKNYPSHAFKGPVAFITIKAGKKIWKLTSYPLVNKGHVSPWWLPFELNDEMKAFSKEVLGFDEIKMRSKNIGCDLKEYIRAWCNVCYDWNALGRMLVVEATEDIHAVFGRFSSQPVISNGDPSVRFIAGSSSICQLWIPGLDATKIKVVSNVH